MTLSQLVLYALKGRARKPAGVLVVGREKRGDGSRLESSIIVVISYIIRLLGGHVEPRGTVQLRARSRIWRHHSSGPGAELSSKPKLKHLSATPRNI